MKFDYVGDSLQHCCFLNSLWELSWHFKLQFLKPVYDQIHLKSFINNTDLGMDSLLHNESESLVSGLVDLLLKEVPG